MLVKTALIRRIDFFLFPINLTDLTNEKENYQNERVVAKETGYLGDVDTSCSDSSQPQGSDSEDDIPIMSRKGNVHVLKLELST